MVLSAETALRCLCAYSGLPTISVRHLAQSCSLWQWHNSDALCKRTKMGFLILNVGSSGGICQGEIFNENVVEEFRL